MIRCFISVNQIGHPTNKSYKFHPIHITRADFDVLETFKLVLASCKMLNKERPDVAAA